MDKFQLAFVDDDADDHLFLQEAVKQIGDQRVVMDSLYSGGELLDYLFRVGKFSERKQRDPSVIVLDVNMPAINGVSLLRTLKSIPQFQKIPVVVLTTNEGGEEEKECMQLGARCYYTKPVRIKELNKIVKEIIHKAA